MPVTWAGMSCLRACVVEEGLELKRSRCSSFVCCSFHRPRRLPISKHMIHLCSPLSLQYAPESDGTLLGSDSVSISFRYWQVVNSAMRIRSLPPRSKGSASFASVVMIQCEPSNRLQAVICFYLLTDLKIFLFHFQPPPLCRHEEAVAECSAALQLNASHLNSLRRRADSLAALGRHGEAASDYLLLVSLDPSNDKWRSCLEQQQQKVKGPA